MRADGGAACDLFITLVHGTWPRNVWRDALLTPFYGRWPGGFFPKNLWFADGSEFRNRLTAALSERGLSAQISPFLWSGENSVRERDKAAHELVEHIRAKQSDYPSSTQVVIAHSHGGNVALRALDQLGVTGGEIFIATIATPFVEILRTKLSSNETRRIDFMVSLIASILVPHYVTTYFSTLNSYVFYSIAALGGLLPFLLLFGLRAWNTRKVDELVGLTALSPAIRKHPLLVLRAVDDEASLALAAATIGNRFSRLLEKSSYKIWVWLPLLAVVFFLVLQAIKSFAPLDDFRAWAFDWVPALSRGLVLAFFAFLFSPGVFNSAYGRELLPIFQGCEINSQSAPDSIDRQSEFLSEPTPTNWAMVVTLHQAEEARRGLRHGLYDDPQCAERIAGWLQSELARRGI
jgi:hypothetical protein